MTPDVKRLLLDGAERLLHAPRVELFVRDSLGLRLVRGTDVQVGHSIFLYSYIYIYIPIYIYIYIYICMYACMYVCMYICLYMDGWIDR